MSLGNTGDDLVLKNAGGTAIDFVAWETGYTALYPAWTLSTIDGTIKRKVVLDTDSIRDWTVGGLGSCCSGSLDEQIRGESLPSPWSSTTSNSNFSVYFNGVLDDHPWSNTETTIRGNLSTGLVAHIGSATNTIYAALYELSYAPILQAFIDAHVAGVTVQIVTDADTYDTYQPLVDHGISVSVRTYGDIMHNKYVIVDTWC
jgi:phosphatidylserine/phosphatidylglycerophosphate/cardiolipin synthase-like enzyme